MANRREFLRGVRVEIITRAKDEKGVPRCEFVENGVRCGCTKGLEVHHASKMDAMTPDEEKRATKLTAKDGLLLCGQHHDEETKMQQADLAKARAQEAAHLGAKPPPDKPLVSRGFAKVSRKDKAPLRVAAGIPEIFRRFSQ